MSGSPALHEADVLFAIAVTRASVIKPTIFATRAFR